MDQPKSTSPTTGSELPLPATAKWSVKHEWRQLLRRNRSTKDEAPNAPEPAVHLPQESNSGPPQPSQEPRTRIVEKDVLEAVSIHKCFQMPSLAPGIKVLDLPNLEDVTEYEVSEEAQQKLWEKEASRLVQVVATDTPLEYIGSNDLTLDTKASYENFAAIADQVWQAMNIDFYDGGNVLAEYAKELVHKDGMKRSRRILDFMRNKEEDSEESGTAVPRVNRKDFCTFVDYVTAILARIICATIFGESMHITLVANLARISTKLKIVSAKPQEFAQISIDNSASNRNILLPDHSGLRGGQEEVDRAPGLGSLPSLTEGLRSMMSNKLEEAETSTKEDSVRNMYFMQCSKFRTGIFRLLRIITLTLRGANTLSRTSLTSYEICSMVYETGFERFRTLVYQDHDNDFLGSSDATNINIARSSFDLLNKAVSHIHDKKTLSTINPTGSNSASGSANESVGTRISWNYYPDGSNGGNQSNTVLLGSMSHVITVMIPLIMTNPVVINSIGNFIDILMFAELPSERSIHPLRLRLYDKYTAYFCLTTDEYNTGQRSRGPNDARSLSNALMRRDNLHSGKHITEIGRTMTFAPNMSEHHRTPSRNNETQTLLGRIQQRQLELDYVSNKMRTWVLEEKGVMVKCKTYVYTVMFACVILVAGSVAAGVTVGQRISGVDPFNITTYCWVLAAFIVLVAKSVRVQTWPWNDFLHGRVLCKSVSELSSVTGVDEQLILAKLLQDESISILQTRGPYNIVFRRSSEDGFSIDRPISTWTMLLSGLVMIEVELTRGYGLVCLDLRRGTKYAYIENLGDLHPEDNTELIYCNRLPSHKDQGTHSHNHEYLNKIRLAKGHMAWLRARGFYGNKNAEFT